MSPLTLYCMHVRWTFASGTVVVCDRTHEELGKLQQPLIDCDTGRIVGFLVATHIGTLLLQGKDIVSWGTKIHVLCADCLAPAEDFIRLQALFDDPRRFLGQILRIEQTNRRLGTVADIQFDTRTLQIEWMFPRRWWRERRPVPASEIVEVTPQAIFVRDPLLRIPRKEEGEEIPSLLLRETLPTPSSRSIQK
jgi:uncharacterized protein YrrD